jgi:hypothetical protein
VEILKIIGWLLVFASFWMITKSQLWIKKTKQQDKQQRKEESIHKQKTMERLIKIIALDF